MLWLKSCVLVGITFLALVYLVLTNNSQNARSMAFEEIIIGRRLVADLVENLVVTSATKCGLACNRNDLCRSFNFCGSETCELNSNDVYSMKDGINLLSNDTNCKYFGMGKESKPICQEDGQFADIIQGAFNPELCQIQKKRVDVELSDWEKNVEIDTKTEFKVSEEREVVLDSAHGGIPVGNSSLTRIHSWLKFVREKKTWNAAREYCLDLSGDLFSDINGTTEQLQFLWEKMDKKSHWMGIYTDDFENWKYANGDVIGPELFVWDVGQPNNHGNQEDKIFSGRDGPALRDIEADNLYWFICDLKSE